MENKLKKTLNKTLIALLATAGVFAGVSAAAAATATTNSSLTVRAKLTNGCSVNFDNGADVIEYGPITDLSVDKPATKSFHIKCTNALKDPNNPNAEKEKYVPSSVALDGGSVTGSTPTHRLLAYADDSTVNDTLAFQVYQGKGGSRTIWGDQGPDDATAPSYKITDPNGQFDFTVVLLRDPNNLKGLTAGTYTNTMTATVKYDLASGGTGGGGN